MSVDKTNHSRFTFYVYILLLYIYWNFFLYLFKICQICHLLCHYKNLKETLNLFSIYNHHSYYYCYGKKHFTFSLLKIIDRRECFIYEFQTVCTHTQVNKFRAQRIAAHTAAAFF